MLFERLSLGKVRNRLLNLRIPLIMHLQTIHLAELRGEDVLLDRFLDPIDVSVEVRVGDRRSSCLLRKVLNSVSTASSTVKSFESRIGCVREVRSRKVEERVIDVELILSMVRLHGINVLIGCDSAATVDRASGVGQLDLAVSVVLGV